jgi:hypothetical protein
MSFQSMLKERGLLLLMALLPAVISITLILALGKQIGNFTPTWSDEIMNLHQAATFSVAGFNGGYYSVQEQPPPIESLHFYTYGPWLSMLYGTIGKLFGWQNITYLIINAVLFTASVVVFGIAVRLDKHQMLLTGIFLSTFWGFMVFYFNGMQESVHHALAALLAAIFYRAIQERHQLKWRWRIAGVLLIALAALLRISWAILFLPFWALTLPNKWYGLLFAVLISALTTYCLLTLAGQTSAPGNNSVFRIVDSFRMSFQTGIDAFFGTFSKNSQKFFDTRKNPLDVVQSIQMVLLFAGALLVIVGAWLRNKGRRLASIPAEAVFHLVNLGGIWAASMIFYLIGTWGDFRIFSTHLMLTLLLLIAFRRFRPVLLFIAISLLSVSLFYDTFGVFVGSKFNPTGMRSRSQWSQYLQLMPLIEYNPDAPNSWCNTLYFSPQYFNGGALSLVPPGIGLSFFWEIGIAPLPIKSRYLWMSTEDAEQLSTREQAPELELMATLPHGLLFRNLSVDCDA